MIANPNLVALAGKHQKWCPRISIAQHSISLFTQDILMVIGKQSDPACHLSSYSHQCQPNFVIFIFATSDFKEIIECIEINTFNMYLFIK